MIAAKIIADSISQVGKRITAFELEYPRFVHSEFMTHRMVSKNAASSRAIPIDAMIKQVEDNPAMPVYWGENQAGMSAKEELTNKEIELAKLVWLNARDAAVENANILSKLGLHKQIVNRILEPWAHIKVVATATEWDNFFHLRRHKDAQPEIHALANSMWDVLSRSNPMLLKAGEYHLPYVTSEELKPDVYVTSEELKPDVIGDCIKLSASLCAQVSYRKSDQSIEKAASIYKRLVESTPVHASPFEHQAMASNDPLIRSGNFIGWHQHRQLLTNNVCNNYEEI